MKRKAVLSTLFIFLSLITAEAGVMGDINGDGALNRIDMRMLMEVLLSQKVTKASTHYVDLGLKSGTLWATSNVGASEEADYGGYYAWGETEEKATYYWSSYFDSQNGSSTLFNIYKSGGETSVIGTTNDAATVNQGLLYQMPTLDQWQELKDSCTWKKDTISNAKGAAIIGYSVTGSNGNSIFLPCSGSKYSTNIEYQGRYFYYWAGELYCQYDDAQSNSLGCYMDATFNNPFAFYGASRCNGYPVRGIVNPTYLPYDINQDGHIGIGDLTALIQLLNTQ